MSDLNNIEKQLKAGANQPSSFEYKEAYWNDALVELKKAERKAFRKRFLFLFWAFAVVGVGVYFVVANSPSLLLSKANLQEYAPRYKSEQLRNNVNGNLQHTAQAGSTANNQGTGVSQNTLIDDIAGADNATFDGNSGAESSTNRVGVNQLHQSNAGGQFNAIDNATLATNTSATSGRGNNNSSIPHTANNSGADGETNNTRNNLTSNTVKISGSINQNTTAGTVNGNNSLAVNTVTTHNTQKRNFVSLDKLVLTDLDEAKSELKTYRKQTLEVISLEDRGNNQRWSLIANVGAIYSNGFNEGNAKIDFPYLGGEINYQLSNRLNISLGGAYYKKTNINGFVKGASTKVYGFGKKVSSSYISLDEITFVEVPLKLNYAIKPYFLVGGGISYSHIIGGKNRMWNNVNIDPAFANLDALSNFQSESKYAYTNIYSKGTYDAFASAEWRYKRIGAEMRYYYGLNDMTQYIFNNSENVDRNSRFLITFKFLLLK